ncbi:hypothetical protein [Legionella sp. 16cNR16C]|uniref:hypothetical protein n=1 Tax=Legionella sp. 16cNR16C TaxID=2905656 RepID=UPI001E32C151|nr:hypothetical protein [Legionella sp. 16cNR16C]MCE3045765.1 hypothetical protein [Legionella sp. 16cNR16C]
MLDKLQIDQMRKSFQFVNSGTLVQQIMHNYLVGGAFYRGDKGYPKDFREAQRYLLKSALLIAKNPNDTPPITPNHILEGCLLFVLPSKPEVPFSLPVLNGAYVRIKNSREDELYYLNRPKNIWQKIELDKKRLEQFDYALRVLDLISTDSKRYYSWGDVSSFEAASRELKKQQFEHERIKDITGHRHDGTLGNEFYSEAALLSKLTEIENSTNRSCSALEQSFCIQNTDTQVEENTNRPGFS